MTKFTISKQIEFLGKSIIYHGIRVGDLEFEPYLYSTFHLKSLKLCVLRLTKKMMLYMYAFASFSHKTT